MKLSELKNLGIIIIFLAIALKIAFYAEPITGIIKLTLGLVWLFLLPGWLLTSWFPWSFTQRILAGTFISGALTGIFSYYAGLFISLRYQWFLWPLIWILIGIVGIRSQTKDKPKQSTQQD